MWSPGEDGHQFGNWTSCRCRRSNPATPRTTAATSRSTEWGLMQRTHRASTHAASADACSSAAPVIFVVTPLSAKTICPSGNCSPMAFWNNGHRYRYRRKPPGSADAYCCAMLAMLVLPHRSRDSSNGLAAAWRFWRLLGSSSLLSSIGGRSAGRGRRPSIWVLAASRAVPGEGDPVANGSTAQGACQHGLVVATRRAHAQVLAGHRQRRGTLVHAHHA